MNSVGENRILTTSQTRCALPCQILMAENYGVRSGIIALRYELSRLPTCGWQQRFRQKKTWKIKILKIHFMKKITNVYGHLL